VVRVRACVWARVGARACGWLCVRVCACCEEGPASMPCTQRASPTAPGRTDMHVHGDTRACTQTSRRRGATAHLAQQPATSPLVLRPLGHVRQPIQKVLKAACVRARMHVGSGQCMWWLCVLVSRASVRRCNALGTATHCACAPTAPGESTRARASCRRGGCCAQDTCTA
jgi:hypothetical protein